MSSNAPEVVCLGEALVDLVSAKAGLGLARARAFHKAAGGAPANVAVGVTRLGRRAAFLGAVGDDPFGRFLRDELGRHGVDIRGTVTVRGRATGVALVSLTSDGKPDFLFYGAPAAHLGLRLTRAMRALIRQARIFHYGSISLLAEPSRSATLAALRVAEDAGVLCSYDPNFRPTLWPDVRAARRWIREGLRYADCVKVNAAELLFLTGQRDVATGLTALLEAGPALAVATLGAEGCAYATPAGGRRLPAFAAKAVDTTGAGDAFGAGMLVGLLDAAKRAPSLVPEPPALEAVLAFAGAAAALSTERRGGIPSLPARRRVAAFLRSHGLRPPRAGA